jgi:hypothetical protein
MSAAFRNILTVKSPSSPRSSHSIHSFAAPFLTYLPPRKSRGDFFDSVPGGYDTYLIKSCKHDWNDSKAVEIL